MIEQFNVLDTEALSEEDIKALSENQQSAWDNANNLIHQVFKQNKQGAKLLKIWKETLIMVPTVSPNSTQFDAGIAEGKKTVVREILLAIKLVEER